MSPATSPLCDAPADRVLVLTRLFDAPRDLVFEAWTKKEHLDQWCAPEGFTVPRSDGDLRPGGAWHACMISPSGEEFRVGGVYREIVANEKLVFTHTWEEDYGPGPETVVTVLFSDHEGKTKVSFHQAVFASKESRDGHEGGWTSCFVRLDALLAHQGSAC